MPGDDDAPGADAGEAEPPPPPGARPDAAPGTPTGAATCEPMTAPGGLGSVLLCVPDGVSGAAPLVVALHGYTQTADEYRLTTEWDVLAGRYGFYVVFPQTQGDLVNAGGLPAAWKWWRDFLPWTRDSFNQHVTAIVAVVDGVAAEHAIDRERVFVTGLSAGGYMTTLLLATHPDVFAAGASFSGGAFNCDLECTDSNKIQDWTRPPGYVPPGASDVVNAWPSYWNDATTRKPRLILFHGERDEAVKPVNLSDAAKQWTGALGIDQSPDNAALGEPAALGGYAYAAYARDGQLAVATVLMSDLGHGTPVKPGAGSDEGGWDPIPSQTAADCSNVSDPGCEQDWTNTGGVYGAYQAARFFGLTP